MASNSTVNLDDACVYLRSLPAVRDRCTAILNLCKENKTENFEYCAENFTAVVDFVEKIINQNFPGGVDTIPFHSRWRHFEPQGIDRAAQLKSSWNGVDEREIARRSLDLAVVSVLLDAGAGPKWKFEETSTGQTHTRSEGLGVASFHMFNSGAFSSNAENPHQVDAEALKSLAEKDLRTAFQVDDETNPLVGVPERCQLLKNLGESLLSHPEYFERKDKSGVISVRPGNMVDYLFAQADEKHHVSVEILWKVVIYGFEKTWPATRTKLNGQSLGDVWPSRCLPCAEFFKSYVQHSSARTIAGTDLAVFHKLSQWLSYSLMEPLHESGLHFDNLHMMTGLAEYRNGGLLIDLGLLRPRAEGALGKAYTVDSSFVVEWRALTVAILDEIAEELRRRLGATPENLPLVKVLEGGTWKAGRVAAKERRADGGPPFKIISDGTVF